MGAVVEAENVALGQRVAIKVLRHELVNNREAQARFDREAKVVSQLVTENVVRVHDLGRTEHDEPFIVMELLSGRTLEELIDAPAQLSIEHAVDLVCEACVGLAVAHAAGVVHRDIKPSNLFEAKRSDGTTVVKVLDFGVTKITRADTMKLTQTSSVFGTPLYMSPEQIMSSKLVDAHTDQHAMGVVLFELLTKQVPYYDEQPTAVTVKIATLAPPRLRELRADIPQRLDAAVRRALAKMPGERFSDIAAFAEAISNFGTERAKIAAARAAQALGRASLPAVLAESLTPPPLAASASEPVVAPPASRRTALVAGVGVALLALALGAFALSTRSSGVSATSEPAASGPSEAAPDTSSEPRTPAEAQAAPPAAPSAEPSPSAAPLVSGAPEATASAAATARPQPTARPRPPSTTKPSATAKSTATGGGEFIPNYGAPKKP